MFTYSLFPEPNIEIFNKYKGVLNNIPGIKSEKLLEDVDGSLIQIFYLDGKKIKLKLDEYVGATYIESEQDLKHIVNIN